MVDRTISERESSKPVRAIRVVVTKGPDEGQEKSATDTLTVGTATTNDLVLSDETVSRFHLELTRSHDRIVVHDYGSTNGTVVGGAWIERAGIAPGTVLKLGRTQLRVDDGETVEVELFDGDALAGLVGAAPVTRQLMAQVRRVATSNASVLLLGETGTGKEIVARAIHALSPRSSGPFEVVDCGSMLPTLIGSELFGHEKGAFTGADQQHVGAFERADGGTLFLDEIGELPQSLQPMLLGALERRSFRRLGGRDAIAVNVRVVSATNRDLRSDVNTGTFRQDLYYRIAVVLLRLPALRERAEDIPLLAEHFLRQAGHEGEIDAVLPKGAMDALVRHSWPGNVRELRNAVEAALVIGHSGVLAPEGAPSRPSGEAPQAKPGRSIDVDALVPLTYPEARARAIEAFERAYVEGVLEETNGNVSMAARRAQMNRTYLSRLMRRAGLRLKRTPDSE
ncbi:MAG: sigma 54-dependent Fis family transcriptional regulator [Deltaproteobacteria bacterium]|nr:sigma 54-dependent Fis family transcriptional regulator [Deltaproteobacteria bacterium]